MNNDISGRENSSTPEDSKLKDSNPHVIENENICVDITFLCDVSGDDPDFIHSTVRSFLKKMPDIINKIEESLHMHDWENAYQLSHSARSLLSVVRINEMLDWMTQIEVNAKNETNSDNFDLLQKIREKYVFAEMILNERFQA